MEIKVREVTGVVEKSKQEIEQELLQKHEEQLEGGQQVTETTEPVEEIKEEKATPEMNEDDVISYIKNRYDREIGSVDELFSEREKTEELPEDVAAYLKYKKETGRGIKDFMQLSRDVDDMSPDEVLRQYLVATEKGLDSDDIDTLMEGYEYDEDIDDESVIKKAKLSKKKAIAKAKDFFESEKEKYKIPLESSGSSISEQDKEKLDAYNQYVQQSTTYEEELKRKQEWFLKKTNEVFGDEFKGFEFNVDEDKKVTFAPADAVELKKAQSNANNFLGKFVDDNGLLNDAEGYHRALAIAMNPEKFAKFFYEQGKSVQADDVMRKMKNTEMSIRKTPEVTTKGGMQVKAMNPDSGRGLKIRSPKNR